MLEKSVIYLELLPCFLVVKFDDIFFKTMNISIFVFECRKTLLKYVIAFLLSISGLKI